MKKDPRPRRSFAMLFGVGFDGSDGHYRQTTGDNFFLVGGSEKTHEVMQEKAVSLNEELSRRGKGLSDVESTEEFRDIAHDAGF